LDFIESRYDALALQPIEEELTRHRENFKAAYLQLDDAQRDKFEILSVGGRAVNPFDSNEIIALYGAGLDEVAYKNLADSYDRVNMTLSDPLPPSNDAFDIENYKFIYRHREYFKTLNFNYYDMIDWLMAAARSTLEDMGVSEELIKIQMSLFETEL